MTLQTIINTLLLRTNSVDDVLRVFNKVQRKLLALSERLAKVASDNEREAQAKLTAARAQRAEVDRAFAVANRIAGLTA